MAKKKSAKGDATQVPWQGLQLPAKNFAITKNNYAGSIAATLLQQAGCKVTHDVSEETECLIITDSSAKRPSPVERKALQLNEKKGASIRILTLQEIVDIVTPPQSEVVRLLKKGSADTLIPMICAIRRMKNTGEPYLIEGADLSGISLSSNSLDDFELRKCNLSKAKLSNISFGRTVECDFTGAKIECGLFVGEFIGCKFQSAAITAEDVSLRIEGCDFTGAKIANIDTGDNQNCVHVEGGTFAKAKFNKCAFKQTDWKNVDLSGADMRDCDWSGTTFTRGSVRGANFTGAKLEGTLFQGVDAEGARGLEGKVGPPIPVGPFQKKLDEVAKQAAHMSVHCGAKQGSQQLGFYVSNQYARKRGEVSAGISTGGRYDHYDAPDFALALQILRQTWPQAEIDFSSLRVKAKASPVSNAILKKVATGAVHEVFDLQIPEELKSVIDTEIKAEDRLLGKLKDQAPAAATDFLTMIRTTVDPTRLDKAVAMLKADRFRLFADVGPSAVAGVVKSQTNADLVYACRLGGDGSYSCCTHNLNVCGGLRGALCKHLLVLILGLVKSGALDAKLCDSWVKTSQAHSPSLDKDGMSELFLKYKGAEAGEIDWRPTETLPEDYYAY